MSKIIPDVVQRQDVISLTPGATVRAAIDLMVERKIGAITIVEGRTLAGIFTERDALTRVLGQQMDPDGTELSKVMTPNPDTLGPDDEAMFALDRMTQRGYRHVPIVEDGALVAIVSIRDLYMAVNKALTDDLNRSQEFILGTGYGG